MKKFLTFILVLAAVLSVSSVALAAPVDVPWESSKTVEQNGDALYNAIMNAADGDTITIAAGTYKLNTDDKSRIIGKSLTLVGAGETETIIESTKYGFVLQGHPDKEITYTLKNMKVKGGSGQPLYVKGNTTVYLENVVLTHPGKTAILIDSANENTNHVCEPGIIATVDATNVTVDLDDTIELLANPSTEGTTDIDKLSYAKFIYRNCKNIVDANCIPQPTEKNRGLDNLYVNGKCINPSAAQIGATKYETLQAAIDDAPNKGTNVTIELRANIAESVAIKQKEGLNLTIQGNENFTMKPAAGKQYIIAIDGTGRSAGSDTLLIKDVVFDFDGTAGAAICAGRNGDYGTPALTNINEYNYAHNVTIEGCDFDLATGIVAVHVWQGYDINISECVVNGGHSLFQCNDCTGATIENTKVSGASEGGINLYNSSDVTISGCTLEGKLYGVRGGAKNDAKGDVTIIGTTIKAEKPIIMRYMTANADYTLNIENEENALTPHWDNTTEPTYDEKAPIYVTEGEVSPSKVDAYKKDNLKQVGGIAAWNKDTNTYYTGWRAAIADAKPGETVYPVDENGALDEAGAVTIPNPSTGSGYYGPNVWYIGGNTFGTNTNQVPTSVEIDQVPVSFTMNGSQITVDCITPGAKWVKVSWGSTTNTRYFTPDANAYCTQTVIPKTGDVSIWAAVATFFGF